MNNLKSLPPTDNLILPRTVVESAALIDVQMAMKLSAALNEMGRARDSIESTRNVDNKGGMNIGHFQRAGQKRPCTSPPPLRGYKRSLSSSEKMHQNTRIIVALT